MERLKEILDREADLSHVEHHGVRLAFIETVMIWCSEDEKFRELVDTQLSMYVGHIDPRTFVEVCNQPGHLVRERMISWYIDHPSKKEKK